jgi:GrpB-like predicted nucleotidyltransferase (UPF0157 family)
MTLKIEIVAYRATWPDEYRRLAAIIRPIAPAGSRLHHIGSTAVPGLAAKDVIDIQLSVDEFTDVDIATFVESGFTHRPGLKDHCPPGAALPDEDLFKLFFKTSQRPAHLHVRQIGRFNQRYALLCRDYLRAHPDAAKAYETVKLGLARRFPDDAEAYYEIKDPVFDIIMAGANIWAERVSWCQPDCD